MADEAAPETAAAPAGAAAPEADDAPAGGGGRQRQYADRKRSVRKLFEGKVVSTGAAKTLVVSIERMVKHRKYKKYIRQHTKVYVHDEQGAAKTGDLVEVTECRPMSRLKRFRLVRVSSASKSKG